MYNYAGAKLKELLKDKSITIAALGVRTNTHPGVWSQVINGSKRLSVDLSIKLSKVFGAVDCKMLSDAVYIYPYSSWIHLQHQSDLKNAIAQDGTLYRNIEPFD